MKKITLIILVFLSLLTGCSNEVKPVNVEKTEFDLLTAKSIMERTWKPVNDLTNKKLETRPNIDVYTKEEFFNNYNFKCMSEMMKDDIFETIVDMDQNGVVKDSEGKIVFGEGNIIAYIPTIFDEGVYIENAYLKKSTYKDEDSALNSFELVIEERSNEEITQWASNFSRNCIFIKNKKDEWILDKTEGIISYKWER
ncbi:hypothetical protein SH2C18_01360 [Clostridium sediminicola]|uniref:hypothetical protein n=1 Tax=Clostridium sediminicola TaxID=3114879 RepID=UPI0031F27749